MVEYIYDETKKRPQFPVQKYSTSVMIPEPEQADLYRDMPSHLQKPVQLCPEQFNHWWTHRARYTTRSSNNDGNSAKTAPLSATILAPSDTSCRHSDRLRGPPPTQKPPVLHQ